MFRGFMNKLRLGVTLVIAIIMIGCIMGVLGINDSSNSLTVVERIVMLIMFIVMALVMYVVIYYWYGKDNKCPSCKKRFCLKKDGEEIIDRQNVSVLVETNEKDRNGNVIGSQEQYVPGERITYRAYKICKKCGERCYTTHVKNVPTV